MSNACFGNPSFLLLFAILAMARVEVDAQTAPSSAAVAASTNRQVPLVAARPRTAQETLQAASAKRRRQKPVANERRHSQDSKQEQAK